MDSTQVEAIERATVQAVSPDAQAEIRGWILPFDAGTVGRAKSAVPLAHTPPADTALRAIEAAYAQRNLPVMLRIPLLPGFDAFRATLVALGYREETVTEVQTASAAQARAHTSGGAVEVSDAPTPDWASVFLGEGFDPVDGASRVRNLGKAQGSLFAIVRDGARPVAAGAAAFGHGWASVHGLRTAQDCRGRGLAGSVLATLAGAAIARGYDKLFLQVAAENAAAKSLYRRAGFSPAWVYSYWRKPLPLKR
jgi:ribosomal protein S18 acetylase RimI-like enzyme